VPAAFCRSRRFLKRRTRGGALSRRGTDCPLGRLTYPGTSLAARHPGVANSVEIGRGVLRLASAGEGHQVDTVLGPELSTGAAAQKVCAWMWLGLKVGAVSASCNGLTADGSRQGCEHQHHCNGERSPHTGGNDRRACGGKVDRS
jgi:hypothetical protein